MGKGIGSTNHFGNAFRRGRPRKGKPGQGARGDGSFPSLRGKGPGKKWKKTRGQPVSDSKNQNLSVRESSDLQRVRRNDQLRQTSRGENPTGGEKKGAEHGCFNRESPPSPQYKKNRFRGA